MKYFAGNLDSIFNAYLMKNELEIGAKLESYLNAKAVVTDLIKAPLQTVHPQVGPL